MICFQFSISRSGKNIKELDKDSLIETKIKLLGSSSSRTITLNIQPELETNKQTNKQFRSEPFQVLEWPR